MTHSAKILSDKKRLIQLSTLVLFAFILYWPCLQGYFITEDLASIEGNRGLLDSLEAFLPTFTDSGIYGSKLFSGLQPGYRPVYRLSDALTYKLAGLDPIVYHIRNIVVHSLVAMLVYALALTLTRQTRIAYLSSLFFVAHYVFTNTIAFISGVGRAYGLMFSLLAMLLYIRWRRGNPKSKLYYVLSILAYLLAMLSIEEAIMLAAVLVAYEVFLHPQEIQDRSHWLKLLPFALALASYLVARKATGGMLPHWGESGKAYNVGLYNVSNMIFYIVYLVSPFDIHRFLPFLDHLQADITVALADGALSWSVLAAAGAATLAGGILVLRQVGPMVRFLLLWIVLFLMPFLMLHHPSSAYLAAPSVGYVILLSMGLCNLVDYSRKKEHRWVAWISYALVVLVLGGYSLSTFRRSILIDRKGDTAEYIVSQVQSRHPTLPAGSELYFANEVDPRTYSFVGVYGVRVFEPIVIGSSFRMIYDNPTLDAHLVGFDDLRLLASRCNSPCGKYFFVYRIDGSIEEIPPGG